MADIKKQLCLVVIEPLIIEIANAQWQQALGAAIALPGGAAVQLSKDVASDIQEMMKAGDWGFFSDEVMKTRVPILIDDPYYPAIEAHVSMGEILNNFIETEEDGPRKKHKRRRCVHGEDRPVAECEYCFYRQWKKADQRIEKGKATV